MKEHGISFKEVIDAYESGEEKYKNLNKKAPVHKVVLNMVINHLPNPKVAQAYRLTHIWRGDNESPEGKALINADSNGPIGFICIKIEVDKHAGEVAAGRLFSGTIKQGDEVYMNHAKRKVRVQQVVIYKGAQRVQVDKVLAGNIVGIIGLKDVFAGETVSTLPMEPFEAITHIFEPVVTKSIEATKASDLPKLVEVLRQVNKEDPSITIEINEETGENLMHGMGELHLEVIENRIKSSKGLDVKTSAPIVVYRETVLKKSTEVEGKSPNKHNKFYIIVEPLEDNVYDAIKAGELPEGRVKKNDKVLLEKLRELGWDAKTARDVRDIFKGCLFMDRTRGEVHIGEVIEMVLDAFEQVMKEGPLAREPGVKIKVSLRDTKLHEDAIHRGPAQVLPAVRASIKGAMLDSGAVIYEPVQILQFEIPSDYMGEISKLVQNKRGQLLEMNQDGEHITVKAKLPVAEMFGLSNDLRSATGGRGVQYLVDQKFEKLPVELQQKVIRQIRERKGLKIDEDLAIQKE